MDSVWTLHPAPLHSTSLGGVPREHAQGTPTQSHISLGILVNELVYFKLEYELVYFTLVYELVYFKLVYELIYFILVYVLVNAFNVKQQPEAGPWT